MSGLIGFIEAQLARRYRRRRMRCVSWNVNGLRAIARKGFVEWLTELGPDLCMLQETKVRSEELPKAVREVPGYRLRVHPAERKGYSGVAIYCREEPDEWIEGLGDPTFDAEGRILWARYGDVLYGSAYFPNSQEAGKRLDYRLAFNDAVLDFCRSQVAKGRHVALGGDYNVAHREIDIARPKPNVKNPGFLPEERAWFDDWLAAGHVDVWRSRNPKTTDAYTWWSYRQGSRARNVGWRLDYFCVDEALDARVEEVGILAEVEGSDHCPVTIRVD